MQRYRKSIRKALRELKCEANEREIAEHLEKLWQKFREWKEGKIGAGELSHVIHEYDRGPSREMFLYYNDIAPDLIVASAIVEGRLSEDEVPAEVLEAIAPRIEAFRQIKNAEQ